MCKFRSALIVPSAIICAALTSHSAVALAANSDADVDTSGSTLSEITVTATRVATNIQDTSGFISAMNGEQLRGMNIVNPNSLSGIAPSLNIDTNSGMGQIHISLRGLASTDLGFGAQSPAGLYLDDVFQPWQFGLATQVYDLNRIEVLNGPQGTLFGKNTTGGALLYYSQAPTNKDEGYSSIDGGGGEFPHYSADGAVNSVINDSLSSRISFRLDRREDYVNNLYDGTHQGRFTDYNLRLQLNWHPSADTKVNLTLYSVAGTGNGAVWVGHYDANPCDAYFGAYYLCSATGVPTPQSPNSRNVYDERRYSYEYYQSSGSTIKLEQAFGDFHLTSITNAQLGHWKSGINDDGTAADYFHSLSKIATYQYSQEVRLATPQALPVHAVIGAFASYDHIIEYGGGGSTDVDPSLSYLFDNNGVQGTTTGAAFTSITYQATDALSLVAGGRYSYESKRIVDLFYSPVGRDFVTQDMYDLQATLGKYGYNPALGDVYERDATNNKWQRGTWDATANFKPTDDSLLYAKVSTGFRSGGYPIGTTGAGTFTVLQPETVHAYEVGAKSEWLGHRLRINGDVYYMDYRNQQVQAYEPSVSGFPVLNRQNAARSRIQGAELTIAGIPIEHLKLSLTSGLTAATYLDYPSIQLGVATNLRDKELPYAPKITSRFDGDYDIPMGDRDLTLGTTWSYRTRVYFGSNDFTEISDPARVIGNLSVSYGYLNTGWRATAHVENVTNVYYKEGGYEIDDGARIYSDVNTWSFGRLWGLKFEYRW